MGGGSTLDGASAEKMHKEGKVLSSTGVDSYESYAFKYMVEDPNVSGVIWEITREQKKTGEDMYEEKLTWTGRKLTAAEVQSVMQQSAKERRSPLNNRLPGGAAQQD